jgi:hypothetical protein
MTKNRRISNPEKMLQIILAARLKFQTVPTSAATRRSPVESTYHQLLAVKSPAYGLVAKINSLPVLMRVVIFRHAARFVDKSVHKIAMVKTSTRPVFSFCAQEFPQ